jgi:hypothetical protein
MFGLGPVELAIAGGLFLFGAIAAFGNRTTKLVLQKLVSHEPASGEAMPVVELVGRQQGIISFLLTLIGISPITDFRVTADELCCNSTSLFGRQNQSVSLRAISSVAAGVRKPVGYLFVAFIFLIVGVFGGLGVLWRDGFYRFVLSFAACAAVAGICIVLYVINKRFFVSVFTQGGPPILLSLKPNVIEGVPLDLERALQVVKIIRDRVIASTAPAPAAMPTGLPPVAITTPSPNGDDAMRPAPAPESADRRSSLPSSYEFDNYEEAKNAASEQPGDLLQQARDLIKNGQRQDAVVVLKEIATRFPASPEASVARATLEKAGITV